MLKVLGAAVAAVVLSCAGAASAGTTYLIASGAVIGDGADVYVEYYIPDPSVHAWEATFQASAPIDRIDYDVYARRHWHYEYDNPVYDYGDAFTVQLPRTVTLIENGFTVRFDMPYDRAYRFDHPEFGYDYWETWNLTWAFVRARIWPGEGQTATFTVSMTAVPEPETWALMIAGFGLAGAAIRAARRRSALLAAQV